MRSFCLKERFRLLFACFQKIPISKKTGKSELFVLSGCPEDVVDFFGIPRSCLIQICKNLHDHGRVLVPEPCCRRQHVHCAVVAQDGEAVPEAVGGVMTETCALSPFSFTGLVFLPAFIRSALLFSRRFSINL